MSSDTTAPAEQQPPAIRFLGDMQRITPNPDDLFVIRSDSLMPLDTVGIIRREFQKVLPGARLVVLGKGMTLECISAQSALLELDKAAAKAKA